MLNLKVNEEIWTCFLLLNSENFDISLQFFFFVDNLKINLISAESIKVLLYSAALVWSEDEQYPSLRSAFTLTR